LVITMQEYSREHVIGLLNRMGHHQLAEEAARALPDPADIEVISEWMMEHGLTHDDLISQMGGSP
jgi:antitoxin component HigA of HigAB toxin-antitoxin module